jgi:hypothetical protein
MECEAEKAARSIINFAFNSMEAATQWLAEHQDIVVGTAVVIAGAAFIVATDGAGALIFVAAAP